MVPSANDRHIVKVEGSNVTLSFDIENAVPSVELNNTQWYYSNTFASSLDDNSIEHITDLETRLGYSSYSYTLDRLQLTISNLSHSDEGRYFIEVSNPAGTSYNYMDLIIHGEL